MRGACPDPTTSCDYLVGAANPHLPPTHSEVVMRSKLWCSAAVAVVLGGTGLSLLACSDSPIAPRTAAAEEVVAVERSGVSDSVVVLRAGGLYNLIVHHECAANNTLGALGATQAFGDPGTALLMNNGGGG